MIIIGHKGSSGVEPENTLEAITRATKEADMVEIDVRLTEDGKLAVIHDAHLNRTTGTRGLVSEETMKELKELNAGEGEQIPTLEEAIEAVNRRVPLLIEMKSLGSAEPLKNIIDSYIAKGWRNDDFIVCSFEHDELRRFAEICPNIKIGVLEVPLGSAEYASDLNAYSVNIDFEGATSEFIEDAHSRGLKVFVWTVDNPKMLLELKERGADGVITDFPEMARRVLTNKPI